MNITTLTSETQADFVNSAFQFGKEDGLEDIGRRGSAYFLIGGEAYQAYDEGHKAGVAQRRQLTGNLPMPPAVGQWLMARQRAEVRRLSGGSEYAPFSDPALMDVQPAEQREDWVGI